MRSVAIKSVNAPECARPERRLHVRILSLPFIEDHRDRGRTPVYREIAFPIVKTVPVDPGVVIRIDDDVDSVESVLSHVRPRADLWSIMAFA